MGILQKLFRGRSDIDVMRLDILMDYSIALGAGRAALVWTDYAKGGAIAQVPLVALLYGRTLINHMETRGELFNRVGELAIETVRTEGATGFEFSPWVLHLGLGGGDHTLWPWQLVSPDQIIDPKTYTAHLRSGQPSSISPIGRWIQLDMEIGLERVLAPASALIAIAGFSQSCDQETRYLLALYLWQMNAYWGTPDQVSIGTEAKAYAYAYESIRSGQLRVP